VTKKAGWEEPSTGPDWIDVESVMRALQALHSARVEVKLSPRGIGFGTGVLMVVSARFDRLPGSQLPEVVEVNEGWPGSRSKTLAALAHRLLLTLDWEISKVYENESLWK